MSHLTAIRENKGLAYITKDGRASNQSCLLLKTSKQTSKLTCELASLQGKIQFQ